MHSDKKPSKGSKPLEGWMEPLEGDILCVKIIFLR